MPHTSGNILLHFIFSTERRRPLIKPEFRANSPHTAPQVERLRTLLPAIQTALLAERARIEHERSRLQAASEWVRRSRQTL